MPTLGMVLTQHKPASIETTVHITLDDIAQGVARQAHDEGYKHGMVQGANLAADALDASVTKSNCIFCIRRHRCDLMHSAS